MTHLKTFETNAIVRSLNGITRVTILTQEHNKVTARYLDKVHHGIFNPFTNLYYIDDTDQNIEAKLAQYKARLKEEEYEPQIGRNYALLLDLKAESGLDFLVFYGETLDKCKHLTKELDFDSRTGVYVASILQWGIMPKETKEYNPWGIDPTEKHWYRIARTYDNNNWETKGQEQAIFGRVYTTRELDKIETKMTEHDIISVKSKSK